VKNDPRIPARLAHRLLRVLMAAALAVFVISGTTSAHATPAEPQDTINIINNSTVLSKYPCAEYTWTYPPGPITQVNNGCSGYSAILQEFANDFGWEYCIDPSTWPAIPPQYQWPGAIQVIIGSCPFH